MGASSSDYSEWNIDDKWSSQEWKSGEMLGARTGRPVDDKFVIDDDGVDSDTATESNFSLKSRSFLYRENERLRKILDHSSKDAMQDIDKRSLIWWMFMSSTLEASVLLRKFTVHRKYRKGSHSETDVWHIWKVDSRTIRWDFGSVQINWEDSSWKQLSLVNDEEVISLSHAEHNIKYCLEQLDWFKDSSQYRALDTIDGEQMEFEWNIFQGFTTLQPVDEVQKFKNKMSVEPEDFTGRIIFMSMFNDITWWIKDNEQESTLVTVFAKKIPAGR